MYSFSHANTRVTQETYDYRYRNVDTEVSAKLENYYENVAQMSLEQK